MKIKDAVDLADDGPARPMRNRRRLTVEKAALFFRSFLTFRLSVSDHEAEQTLRMLPNIKQGMRQRQ